MGTILLIVAIVLLVVGVAIKRIDILVAVILGIILVAIAFGISKIQAP